MFWVASFGIFVQNTDASVLLLVREGDKGQQVASQIAKGIETEKVIISNHYIEGDYSLVVALEDDQLDTLPANISTPVLGAYTSIGYTNPRLKKTQKIYRSPHPSQLGKAIKRLFSDFRIGYIYSDYSKYYFDQLQLSNSGIATRFSGNIYRDITTLIKEDIDLFLLFDDRTIYQDKNIRKVIETLYRGGVPIITTSPSLKNAGPITTLFIDHNDYIKIITDEINQAIENIDKNRYGDEKIYSKKIMLHKSDRMLDIFNLSLPPIRAKEFYEQ